MTDLRSMTTGEAEAWRRLREVAQAAVDYDAAIQACANDPDAMATYTTAQGRDLDELYYDWISKSRAAIAAMEPPA